MSGLIAAAEAALDRRLNSDAEAPLALALSGGGDSMALLHLANDRARRRGRKLLALTVDHGLNADSVAWTAFAGEAARALGVTWRCLVWRGDKPIAGLAAAAREARHRLLAEAAREAGAEVILFAHTADDVAEGEIMRAWDAPRLGYLREWSPSPVWPEGRSVFTLRPLLTTRRAALRAWLQAQGAAWLDDPANADLRFARTRARAALASLEALCEQPMQTRSDPHLAELAANAEHWLDGRITVPIEALDEAERGAALRLLSICIVCASGRAAPPRTEALERLLGRAANGEPFVASLGGARIALDAGAVVFAREAGEMTRSGPPPLTLRAGQAAVWDGRFEIEADADLEVAPLAGSAARLSKHDRGSMIRFPTAIRPALPAIFFEGAVSLSRPFGVGPAFARALAAARFEGACGLVTHERDISRPGAGWGMAQGGRSSYVEALALA